MKKTILTFYISLIVQLGFAQLTIEKSSIDSGGGVTQIGDAMIVSTIGEVAIQENTNATIHISEGFLSPQMVQTLDLNTFDLLKNIQVYPNPTVDFVTLTCTNTSSFTLRLVDWNGRVLLDKKFEGKSTQINLSDYANATYMLVLTDTKNKRYTGFKIIKK